MLFGDEGYDVISTTNPDDVLDIIREQEPNLITLDLLIPNKSGMNVYRELRTNKEFERLPVIVVSGANPNHYMKLKDSSSADQQELAPPDAFIEKPIESFKLLATVKKLVNI